ncbi:phage head morphogenesis protein [Bosea vaviloviae]|uniref:phage head morphogenesis protein n=1 Tax=Bosea vaviloviae TaxID=1526658 RepID=UPI0009E67E23|nr:phage minor head protein [Bosea vaviloviae]
MISRVSKNGAVQFAFDKAKTPRADFSAARRVERRFVTQLRKVARHIGDLVSGFAGEFIDVDALSHALDRYAQILEPWARAVSGRMIAEVAARDEKAWMQAARQMGMSLKSEIADAPTGARMRELLEEQVRLIKSLPTEAAERVHKLTLEGITKGLRASEISAEIMRTGEVTKSRADLIARTEVGRTSAALTQARAEHVGSVGYVWVTAGDSDVRPSHKAMSGKFVAWNDPPTLDGMQGHAGALPNCRCFCRPVLPGDDD